MILAEVVINKENLFMPQMLCSKCGKYGIYWTGLGTISPYTECPHCGRKNCHIQEEENEESGPDEGDACNVEDTGDR
jgi:hypothetical protein